MYLASLRLRNFRNFADVSLDFPPEGVAIIGDNGQGKTNLLEAIYYLEIFRSFRAAADHQLVRFDAGAFHLDGQVSDESTRRITAAYERSTRRKKVTVDGAEPERMGDAIGMLAAVVFSPSDIEIVSGSPGARRRYLDIVLSLTQPGYLQVLQRYRHILNQRNALLRQGASGDVVRVWDRGIAESGARIIGVRDAWVRRRARGFADHVARISDGADAVLEYVPSVAPPTNEDSPTSPETEGSVDAITDAFLAELERVEERERRRGMTLVGPHRDDLRMRAETERAGNLADLRTFGSGGQQRTAAVALRMIEADTLRETRGGQPIVLLDDVFAELDLHRSERILEWVDQGEGGQVILTAPKPTDFDVRGSALTRWQIRRGTVQML